MAKDSVYINFEQINRLTIELKGFEEQVGQSFYHSLNRVVDQVVTQVGRIVPKVYAVKAADVKASFRGGIKKPTLTDLTATITSRSHRFSFAHFPHSPKIPRIAGQTRKDVKVIVYKHKGKIPLKSGFIATTGARSPDKVQYNVFKRIGEYVIPTKGSYKGRINSRTGRPIKRELIAPVRTVTVPQMIGNAGVTQQVQEFAQTKMAERLEHEIIRSMTSIAKRVKRG